MLNNEYQFATAVYNSYYAIDCNDQILNLLPEEGKKQYGEFGIVLDKKTPYQAIVSVCGYNYSEMTVSVDIRSGNPLFDIGESIDEFECGVNSWRHEARKHGFILRDKAYPIDVRGLLPVGPAVYKAYAVALDEELSTPCLAYDDYTKRMYRCNNWGDLSMELPDLKKPSLAGSWNHSLWVHSNADDPQLVNLELWLNGGSNKMVINDVKKHEWRDFLFDLGILVSLKEVHKNRRRPISFTDLWMYENSPEYYVYPSDEPWAALCSDDRKER